MPERNATVITLALINLSCAALHAAFQVNLLSETGRYRGFLLTENMVVIFIFAYFAITLLFSTALQKRSVLLMSIFFWASFLLFVVSIQPTITTLTLVEYFLFLPQSYYLFFTGCIALALSFTGYRQIQRQAEHAASGILS